MKPEYSFTDHPTSPLPGVGSFHGHRGYPETIGPYRIQREIGRGGMGHVYLGLRDDRKPQQRVAIKVLRFGSNARALEWRFKSERQILASLHHPNIARLIDGGTTDDQRPYFVMDHIEGIRIDHYCDQHRLTIAERLHLFLRVCDAVQYAHRNHVVHRDVKPSNILVTAEGVPKLLDFGIAKLLNPELRLAGMEETITGQHPMTPRYASPEQIRGQAITTASDIYSLGVLLYKLLAGRLPRQPHAIELLERIIDEEPTSLCQAVDRADGPGSGGRGDVKTGRAAPSFAGQSTVGAWPAGKREDSDSQGVSLPETIAHLRRESLPMLRHQLAGDLDRITLMALRREPERRYSSVEQMADDIRHHLHGRPVSARAATFGYHCLKLFERHRWGVSAGALILSLLLVVFGHLVQQSRADRSQIERLISQRETAQAEWRTAEALNHLWHTTLLTGEVEDVRGDATSTSRDLVLRALQRLETQDLEISEKRRLQYRLELLLRQLERRRLETRSVPTSPR